MTDDEILLLADHTTNKLCVRSVTDDDLLAFAKAVIDRERERVGLSDYIEVGQVVQAFGDLTAVEIPNMPPVGTKLYIKEN